MPRTPSVRSRRRACAATGRASPTGRRRSRDGRRSACPRPRSTARRLVDGLLGPRPADQRGLGRAARGSGWRRRRRDRSAPDGRRRRRTSSAKPTATLEMSSNRRLAILWKAVDRRERQRDPHGPDQLVRLPDVCAVAGEVVGERHRPLAVAARPAPPRRPSASSAGGLSPMGEAVPRLPPSVAPLRISRDANCGKSSSSTGTRPARRVRSRSGSARRRSSSSSAPTAELAQLLQPVDRDDQLRAARRGG